ncbi:SusC/RagA family TonB-linked outer membrane protein [Pedobacter changchengzhani]|uniref:SusC/RagA family TonB-linked outer membrane protein n=1 Tax=Pedobacter changchengzhani TaxID=2529274 RepID=A0A4R5MKN9_9SPHI|nr:SusC/RagA family TonB-linked outer membrane protein [Pedobacter changchengzhani]TDG36240.1 SusC/RagA family TonB-linked outer membrane protein [Pedobacter changchengzhani]
MKRTLLSTCIVFILLALQLSVSAQDKQITGTVNDQTGKGIPSATVKVKESKSVTQANNQGKFTIKASAGQHLEITSIGYASTSVLVGSDTDLKITLKDGDKELGEVVVTALGIKREKRSLGYAVQEIKGDDVNEAKDPNIVNSLSGKISGIQVTSGGSSVGASSRITIRGNASLGSNTPLFVVDGTPINNSAASLDGNGGLDYGNVTSDIDANNIASVSVLKGSAASALYGSRAANGVILITTKKGNAGGKNFGVDVSSSFMSNKPAYFIKTQNLYGGGDRGSEYDWKKLHPELSYQDYAKQYSYNWIDGNGGGVNDGNPVSWGPRMDAGLLLDQWSTGPNSPWISRPNSIADFYQNGNNVEQNVSVYSKGEKAFGRLGFTRSDNKGLEYNTGQNQNTLSGSITLTPSSKFSIETNVNYLTKDLDVSQNGYYSSMQYLQWFQRDIDIPYMRQQFDKQGNVGNISPFLDNMYYSLTNTNKLNRNRFYGNTTAKYQINDWLNILARGGTDFYNEYRKGIVQAGSADNVAKGRGGQFNQSQNFNQDTNADLILSFDKQISDFRISGLVGGNYRDVTYKSMYLSAPDLTVADVFNIANVKGTPGVSNYDSQKTTESVYASADFSYKNYIFLGLTARNDWSSSLPAEKRSYFYPSVNLGFIFTDAFKLQSDVLTYGKIRASFANVGGDTGPYRLQNTYSGSSFGGVSIFNQGREKPPVNLKPEETRSFEIGTNLAFFKNRINLDFSYYRQKTVNQILSVPVSSPTGFSSALLNAGEISNNGVELQINAGVVKNPTGLSYDVTLNFATNKNTVNKLYGNLQSYIIGTGPGGVQTIAVPGKAWGTLYGLGFVRDANNNIVIDGNGVPATSTDVKELGNVTPKWTGGLQNTFSYKKVQLSFLVDARWGSDFFSTTLWHGWANGSGPATVADNVRETGLVVPGVLADGTPNTKRVSAQTYYGGDWLWNNLEFPIVDGSFVKLREMTLSYPFNVSKIKGIQSLRLTLLARNVAMLYRSKLARVNGIDPETGFGAGNNGVGFEDFQLPGARSFGLKLNVGF